jgi:hypothetical protein
MLLKLRRQPSDGVMLDVLSSEPTAPRSTCRYASTDVEWF